MRTIYLLLLLLAAASAAVSQTVATTPEMPAWTPPPPRTKAMTLFAPKPIKSGSIFKGEAEGWLADAVVRGMSLEPIKDQAVSDYISQLGQNLVKYSAAPNKTFTFVVLDDPEENAFSIGAGRIYINLGALRAAETEDQLASVLAHEIGHDAFGHPGKTVTRQLFWMTGKRKVTSAADVRKALDDLVEAYRKNEFAAFGESLLGWARFQELEADKAGFYTMYKAGYNPEAMKTVFRRFVAETKREAGDRYNNEYFYQLLFGSHPPSSLRVTALKWESNWVKLPPKEDRFGNAAFSAMKQRIKGL